MISTKDPDKPGEWTPATAAATKNAAIDDAKKDMPALEGKMQSLGIKNPDETLGKMVEEKVAEMQAAEAVKITAPAVIEVKKEGESL